MYNKALLLYCICNFAAFFAHISENTQPKLIFRAQTSQEAFNFVIYLSKKLSWFENNGYNIGLPKHPALESLYACRAQVAESHLACIKHIFETEVYKGQDFAQGLLALEKYRKSLEQAIMRLYSLNKQWGFDLKNSYEIVLTLYGPGGNYWLTDNTGYIIVKLNQNNAFTPYKFETVIHEIVHIGIEEDIVKKYRLTHWEKERLVDLICSVCFSDILPEYYMQENGDKKVDEFVTVDAIRFDLISALEKFVKAYPR